MSFTEIAKMVGQSWQVLPPEEKEAFESEAAAAKHEYNAKLLEYKKTDSYKEHVRYLADFRARHGGQHCTSRRPPARPRRYVALADWCESRSRKEAEIRP